MPPLDELDSRPKDLEFLQTLTERELCELVLLPLLSKQGYGEIRYTHGKLENGKDIVFTSTDPWAGKLLHCATVKRTALTGAVTGNRSIREIYYQVKQALTHPYLNPFDGAAVFPKSVYIITPFQISPESSESIKGELQALGNHVFFIDGPTLVTTIRRDLPDLLDSLGTSELRYLHQLAERANELPQIMSAAGYTKPTLTDLYTGGRLTTTTKEKARLGSFFAPLNTDTDEINFKDALRNHKYFAIISDAGAGKTTCLKRITLDLIELKKANEKTPFPIFVPLHRLSAAKITSTGGFFDELKSLMKSEFSYEHIDVTSIDNCTLLLDGFDEIATHHEEITAMFNELPKLFSSVIVTSRPSRVPDLSDEFKYLSLVPFNERDIRSFLYKWFGGQWSRSEAVSNHILADHNLHAFCRNPMILSMYAALASRQPVDSLPKRKTEIYAHVIELLIDEWDRMRGLISSFDSDEKRYALEAIAYRVHKQQRKTFYRHEVAGLVNEFLQNRSQTQNADDLLDEIIFRTSLIRNTWQYNELEFAHLSFQEFFAAQWMQRTLSKNDVQDVLFDEWWKNCVRFYCGITRTLDGLLPRKKSRAQGKVLWLGEYLAEADFTASATKDIILEIIDRELAVSNTIENDEIEYAVESGDELVRCMSKRFTGDRIVNVFNYLRVLMILDSAICREEGAHLLSKVGSSGLSQYECLQCLTIAISRIKEAVWHSWALSLIESTEEIVIRKLTEVRLRLPRRDARRIIRYKMERELDDIMLKINEIEVSLQQRINRHKSDQFENTYDILQAVIGLRHGILEKCEELVEDCPE
jgi:hypothetical protein